MVLFKVNFPLFKAGNWEQKRLREPNFKLTLQLQFIWEVCLVLVKDKHLLDKLQFLHLV